MNINRPKFSGVRVMMMPFRTHDALGSLPALNGWREYIAALCSLPGVRAGVGYLTIDEAWVPAGETQRRPGLHVDGAHGAAYGGGPSPYAYQGALIVSSDGACAVFGQCDDPGDAGDCSHIHPGKGQRLEAWAPWWIGPHTLHEALPARRGFSRQMARISMPSNAPHHADYTPNPLGIVPLTPPAAPRVKQMGYRE